MIALYRHIKKKRASRQAPARPAPVEGSGTTPMDGAHNVQDVEPTAEQRATERAEKTRRRKYRWKLIAGLILPNFLASVDLTIVASALPFIASYFGEVNQLNWIVTAYSLTSTAFIPFFGQVADVFGRHTALQSAMVLMLISSALCAGAQVWAMLLLGRAIQGVGAAGIMNIIKVIQSDNVSLEDNAKNNTIFALVGGISYSMGPVIGGYLTAISWRWCFILSTAVSVLASAVIFLVLRKELVEGTARDRATHKRTIRAGLATFDVGGTILFLFGVGLIILATAWGGATYPWSSAAVLVPLIVGAILFCLFWLYEYGMEPGHPLGRTFPSQVAMIPWKLFERRDTFLLAIINAATGAALYSVFYFIGIYFVLAQGYDASKSGVQLLFYIPGLGGGAYLAMFACNVWPGITFAPLWLGSVIEMIGVGLISWAAKNGSIGVLQRMMAVAGVGTGLRFMPGTLHAAGLWPNKLAPTLSLMDFALPFGGTLAITVQGAVFNNKLAEWHLESFISHGAAGASQTNGSTVDAIAALPPEAQAMVRAAFADAVRWAFVAILPFMGCCVIAATLLGNVWVKGKKDGTSEVLYGSYLWATATGTVGQKKVRHQVRDARNGDGSVAQVHEVAGAEKAQSRGDVETAADISE